MENIKLTETQVMTALIDGAKLAGEVSPRAIVVSRIQPARSMTRKVRIALVIATDNELILDSLIAVCVDNDNQFNFVGSEVNLQADMEIDYLFFEADIMAKR